MRINEVEQRVGITKKNIRFYEQQGLLKPERNAQNGYREYSEEDLLLLQKIKLLRKLSIPIEEIRKIETGALTMEDALRRHRISLEREQKNVEEMQLFCQMLIDHEVRFSTMDALEYLEKMEHMEKEGTRFMNIQAKDRKHKFFAPLVMAVLMVAFMIAIVWTVLWAYAIDPMNRPPMPFMIIVTVIPIVIIIGVLWNLWKRYQEIKGGEEDVASKY
ncbi:MerR family transcriptional regulator [Frisingicoccus sp.]|uniref:MerR family transcriptional regulator n=1 Tax=Frisingicoccus sp. TaxID=1918627 RepID=UPI003AB1B8FB